MRFRGVELTGCLYGMMRDLGLFTLRVYEVVLVDAVVTLEQ
jgi:hypothetical protein